MKADEAARGIRTLAEVCDINPPRPNLRGLPDSTPILFVPMAAVDDETGKISDPQTRTLGEVKDKSYRTFTSGDVLFAKITPCMENGKSAIVPSIDSGIGFGSTEFHVLRPRPGISNRLIWHFLRQESLRRNARENMTGSVGQARVPAGFLASVPVQLSEATQQDELADLLDRSVEAGRSTQRHLANAHRVIERFRQAVLATACSGRLTAEWRAANPSDPEQICSVLKACQLEREARLGRRATTSSIPTEYELPELPNGWRWVSLSELTVRIADVDHRMPKAQEVGTPYVSTKDFTEEGIDFNQAKLISNDDFVTLSRKIQPSKGDILISRYGTVGQVRLVQSSEPFQASYSIAIVKTVSNTDLARWIALALRSGIPQSFMREHIRASAQPDLGLQHIRQIPVPVPPPTEQAEISRRLADLSAFTDSLIGRVKTATRGVERSSEVILAKAFRGELTSDSANATINNK